MILFGLETLQILCHILISLLNTKYKNTIFFSSLSFMLWIRAGGPEFCDVVVWYNLTSLGFYWGVRCSEFLSGLALDSVLELDCGRRMTRKTGISRKICGFGSLGEWFCCSETLSKLRIKFQVPNVVLKLHWAPSGSVDACVVAKSYLCRHWILFLDWIVIAQLEKIRICREICASLANFSYRNLQLFKSRGNGFVVWSSFSCLFQFWGVDYVIFLDSERCPWIGFFFFYFLFLKFFHLLGVLCPDVNCRLA